MINSELLQQVRRYIEENRLPETPMPMAPMMVHSSVMADIDAMEDTCTEPETCDAEEDVPAPSFWPRFKRQKAVKAEKAVMEESIPIMGNGIHPGLAERLREKDESFSEFVIRNIDASGMTDAECYTKAQITRQLFNKLKNVKGYRPGKGTAVALGFALGLDRAGFDEMLRKAGLSLSRSSEFDLIVEYCIEHGIYDVSDVNELLYEFDQPLLGSN